MTVPVQTPVANHTGNGVTTAFAFGYKLLDEDDIVVTVDSVVKTLGIDYTVAGVGVEAGGTVTFSSAPLALAQIDLVRRVAINRLTDYQYSGDFESPTVNRDFDRIVMMLQDSGLALANTIRLPPGDLSSGVLPNAVDRALKGLAFDADGNLFLTAASGNADVLAAALASASTAVLGGGLVGYDGALIYGAGTAGKGIKDAAAAASTAIANASTAQGTANSATTNINTFKTDVADVADAAKGAGLMGFSSALGYAAGTVGKWLKDLTTSAGAGLIGFIQSGTGAVLRTLQAKMRDTVSVMDFGATGDGVTNDRAAIQAAIDAMVALGGGEVFFPRGVYQINAELTITQKNIRLRGTGRGSSIIRTTAAANCLHVSGGAGTQEYFTCHGLGFKSSIATPTAGAAIYLDDAPYSNIYDINISNVFDGIRVRSGFLSKIQDFDILDAVNAGLLIQTTNDVFVRNFSVRTTNTARHNLAAVRIEDFAEAIVMESGEVVGGQRSLSMEASSFTAGSRPAYNRFSNIYFDSGELKSRINNCVLLHFEGCWWSGARSGAGAEGLEIDNVVAVDFNGCTWFNNGVHGCAIRSAAARVRFIGCQISSNGATTAAGSCGLYFAGNASNFTVQSCTFSNGLYSGNQQYGLYMDTGTANNVTIMGNDFVTGGTTAGLLDNSGAGAQKFISSNRV